MSKKPLKRGLFLPKKKLTPCDYTSEELKAAYANEWETLAAQREAAEAALDKWRLRLYRRKDVSGMHVGLKRIEGKLTTPLQIAFCIHVTHKPDARGEDQPANPLESKYEGVPTDVIEMNYSSTNNGTAEDVTKQDPLIGGVAIARKNAPNDWGTLGAVVYRFGKELLLTNKHLAGDPSTEIIQPPLGPDSEVIGSVTKSVLTDRVDCALIEPNSSRQLNHGILGTDPTGDSLRNGKLVQTDEHLTEVFKVGAKTGSETIRFGIVESVGAEVKIPNLALFKNQILVSNESGASLIEPGDSGSLLLKQESEGGQLNLIVVGLVHAQTDEGKLVASHFSDVRNAIGISLHP